MYSVVAPTPPSNSLEDQPRTEAVPTDPREEPNTSKAFRAALNDSEHPTDEQIAAANASLEKSMRENLESIVKLRHR